MRPAIGGPLRIGVAVLMFPAWLLAATAGDARDVHPTRPVLAKGGDAPAETSSAATGLDKKDAQVAQTLLLLMVAPEFDQRPAEEKHAIYAALGATGGDEVIPELEAELLKGSWFERVNEAHRQTVARCLARIGTPLARMVLENGAKSRRAQVRDACADLVAKWESARG